ncbi:MAG: hypothetical protein EZS28_050859 [Streblomastix strix]|uniref:Uncharacterized protein n=1 Tax=Streblomastix strix TaxID=222440 RepID=A0A5J4T5J9_9EUKA|nr:MAG: hypothetical protein EZS28_050859 [Streblomastix strix]
MRRTLARSIGNDSVYCIGSQSSSLQQLSKKLFSVVAPSKKRSVYHFLLSQSGAIKAATGTRSFLSILIVFSSKEIGQCSKGISFDHSRLNLFRLTANLSLKILQYLLHFRELYPLVERRRRKAFQTIATSQRTDYQCSRPSHFQLIELMYGAYLGARTISSLSQEILPVAIISLITLTTSDICYELLRR